MTTTGFAEMNIEARGAYSLDEALAFVRQHLPADRLRPIGSAEGFGHWYFLARGELEPASSRRAAHQMPKPSLTSSLSQVPRALAKT